MTFANIVPVPQTCYQIIQDAMVDAGKIGQGREPNGEQLAENMRRLNKLVNYLQTQGLKLWVQEDFGLAAPNLQAGVSKYILGPGGTIMLWRIRRIIEAYYTELTSGTRRPIGIISRNEWDSLSTTTQQGTITSIFPDKQQDQIWLNVWMTPSVQQATGTLHLILDEQIANFSMLTDTMNFPPEWQLCLEWGLANQICTGMPQEIVDRCGMNAEKYQIALENWDVEDASTVFQPDPRGGYSGKRVGRY